MGVMIESNLVEGACYDGLLFVADEPLCPHRTARHSRLGAQGVTVRQECHGWYVSGDKIVISAQAPAIER